jgi:metallo-beta-lactamase class B
VIAHLTPGHTKGCTTWTLKVEDGGKELQRGHRRQPQRKRWLQTSEQPEIPQDRTLKALPFDIFMGAHGVYFGVQAKIAGMSAGKPSPFIDPQGYKQYVDDRESAFEKELARQSLAKS